MAEDLKTRVAQLTEQLDLAEKKTRAYRSEVHQAAKDFGHIANVHASEYASRRREATIEAFG
jgi:hypothetical protein